VSGGLPFAQFPAGVRFGWALPAALALSDPAGALVIVDVLSFTTSVTIAVSRGTTVYPHRWPDPGVEAFATARDAAWAVRRDQVSASHPWSLSPAALLAAPAPGRLVLPSPNGSAIAAAAAAGHILAGCLRNATAVARWLAGHGFGNPDRPATIIAAGERWPAGELRPALEDLLGAGAIIAALGLPDALSPEAAAAGAAWRHQRQDITNVLHRCSSGQELTAAGHAHDVDIAAQHDTQETVPILTGGAFRPAKTTPESAWQEHGDTPARSAAARRCLPRPCPRPAIRR
jgi:2-phosphosulfolactate phosphatase